jgi:hypothetical protein
VKPVDLNDAGDFRRIVSMMSQWMMRVGDPDFTEAAVALLPSQHQRDDAGNAGLKRQDFEVEHQPGMLVPGGRYSGRPLQARQIARRLALRTLNAPLNVADGIQILGNLGAVGRPDFR